MLKKACRFYNMITIINCVRICMSEDELLKFIMKMKRNELTVWKIKINQKNKNHSQGITDAYYPLLIVYNYKRRIVLE